MPDVLADARELIQSHLAEIDAEAKSLERAIAGLGEGSAPKRRLGQPRKRPAAAVPAAPKPKRGLAAKRKAARAPRGQRREQVFAAVAKLPGARPGELAKEVGISANHAYAITGRLRREGAIRKSGKGYRLAKKSAAKS